MHLPFEDTFFQAPEKPATPTKTPAPETQPEAPTKDTKPPALPDHLGCRGLRG